MAPPLDSDGIHAWLGAFRSANFGSNTFRMKISTSFRTTGVSQRSVESAMQMRYPQGMQETSRKWSSLET
jgi:hypothetical protein